MAEKYLKLVGTDGLSKGEVFWIRKGEMVLMGRSHTCQICLSDIKAYQELDPKDEISHTKFRTIDGKHVKIFFKDIHRVVLADLSKNGTYLDGEKLVGEVVLEDMEENSHILLLGLEERFRIEISEKEAEEEENQETKKNEELGNPKEEAAEEEVVVEEKEEKEEEEAQKKKEREEEKEEEEKLDVIDLEVDLSE